MGPKIRVFLLFEAATFVAASFIHSGALIGGYAHQQARIAEGVIAIVLLVGAALTWIRPAWTRPAGLAAQGFEYKRTTQKETRASPSRRLSQNCLTMDAIKFALNIKSESRLVNFTS